MCVTEKLLGLLPSYFLEQSKEHALTLLDLEGRICVWTKGAAEVYGYRPEEALGKHVSLIFTPEDTDRGLSDHEILVARTTGSMDDDRWMLRKDGIRIWVTGILTALHTPAGEHIGFAKLMRNRTDLRVFLERLENQVTALKKSDDQKSKFLAILGHELRNPLAPLASATELLRLELGNDSQLIPMVQVIERQGAILKKLVEDLLDVARISEGKVHFDRQSVDLGQVLRETVESCRSLLEQRRHTFELLLPSTAIIVSGDPTRLHQVFVNLINNAAKYTDNGGRISANATIEGHDAIVSIEDNGVGISAEALPKIFELFTQEESAGRRTHSGLGIGLSLVKEFVTLHGGSVQVYSDGKNKGSTFIVRLPLDV